MAHDLNNLPPKKYLLTLRNRIAEVFTTGDWREVAILTEFTEINTHPRLLRSLGFNDADYPDCVLYILDRIYTLAPAMIFEIMDFLDTKYPESIDGQNISSEVLPGKKIVFNPLVFQIPHSPPNPNSPLVSVMMPFSADFEGVFSAISLGANGVDCLRAKDIWEHSTIIQDVFNLIFRSSVVICDFTGKNPNVFYEAGIAHTLGKHVIPITQNPNDIPFDLAHHRFLPYLNNGEGLKLLSEGISQRLYSLNIPF